MQVPHHLKSTLCQWPDLVKRSIVDIRSLRLGLYRPPKQQAVDDAVLYEETQAITQNKQSVIIGGFKCPNINWTTMYGDQEGKRLLKMLEDTILTQIITQPMGEKNLLDLVLVSDSDLTRECQVSEKP